MLKLTEEVRKIITLTLDESNDISGRIAMELARDGYNTRANADVCGQIMDLTTARVAELEAKGVTRDPDPAVQALFEIALMIETAMYLGINAERCAQNSKQERSNG